jgi:hypothetical protein
VDRRGFVRRVVVALCEHRHSATYADLAIMPMPGAREVWGPCGVGRAGGERTGEIGIITAG